MPFITRCVINEVLKLICLLFILLVANFKSHAGFGKHFLSPLRILIRGALTIIVEKMQSAVRKLRNSPWKCAKVVQCPHRRACESPREIRPWGRFVCRAPVTPWHRRSLPTPLHVRSVVSPPTRSDEESLTCVQQHKPCPAYRFARALAFLAHALVVLFHFVRERFVYNRPSLLDSCFFPILV